MGLIAGHRFESSGNCGIFAGVTIRFAGVSMTNEMQLWGKVSSIYQADNPDESLCPSPALLTKLCSRPREAAPTLKDQAAR